MPTPAEEMMVLVDRDIARLQTELADAQAVKRGLLKYMPAGKKGGVTFSASAAAQLAQPEQQTPPPADMSKRARIFKLAGDIIEIIGPMTARQLLEHFDASGNADVVTGPDFNARVSTLSSILSRESSPFRSDKARGGYVPKNEKPGQGSNLDRAEQQTSLV